MTVRFVCTTRIEAPVETVFDLALDIDAHTGSMEAFGERAVEGVTTGSIGLGDQVTWEARHLGRTWRMTSRIVELQRPHAFIDEQVRGPFASFRHEHRFEPADGASTMIDDISFKAPYGPLGVIAEAVVLRRYMRALIDRRNRYLKARAEGGE
jgi:ligand-binding SRPBCC domain-containing protein